MRLIYDHYEKEKVADGKVFEPFLKCGFGTFSDEFRTFKDWGASSFEGRSMKDTWATIALNPTLLDQVPNLYRISQVATIMFVSTACCERGFSRQNLIKSKLRARMEIDLLDKLMRIGLVGPRRSDMDFEAAIEVWKNAGKGRRRMYVRSSHLK